MGVIAEALRELMAAGLTGDALVDAIERIEDKQKNSSSAERQRRYRERLSLRVTSRDAVTSQRNERNASHSAISFLDSSLSECPSDSQGSKDGVGGRASGSRLSAEWHPTDGHYSEGLQLGLDKSRVDALALDMRLWADANKNRAIARKSNWNSTFSGWMRRAGKPVPSSAAVNGAPAAAKVTMVTVEVDSPQAKAWAKHLGKPMIFGRSSLATVPSEWPPGHPNYRGEDVAVPFKPESTADRPF